MKYSLQIFLLALVIVLGALWALSGHPGPAKDPEGSGPSTTLDGGNARTETNVQRIPVPKK